MWRRSWIACRKRPLQSRAELGRRRRGTLLVHWVGDLCLSNLDLGPHWYWQRRPSGERSIHTPQTHREDTGRLIETFPRLGQTFANDWMCYRDHVRWPTDWPTAAKAVSRATAPRDVERLSLSFGDYLTVRPVRANGKRWRFNGGGQCWGWFMVERRCYLGIWKSLSGDKRREVIELGLKLHYAY